MKQGAVLLTLVAGGGRLGAEVEDHGGTRTAELGAAAEGRCAELVLERGRHPFTAKR